MRDRRKAWLSLACLWALFGCAGSPEDGDRCRARPEESSVEFDCTSGDEWSQEALDEAEKDMERRRRSGRP